MVKIPLYGHVSEATAYVVDDYPYGFRQRTSIRYWVENSPKKGYRFVSQTLNPKNGRWNAPKKSTYMAIAGAMYLDENNHVQWSGLGEYSSDKDFKSFIESFPAYDMTTIKFYALAKVKYLQDIISGKAYWTINGVKQETTPTEIEQKKIELDFWLSIK